MHDISYKPFSFEIPPLYINCEKENSMHILIYRDIRTSCGYCHKNNNDVLFVSLRILINDGNEDTSSIVHKQE